MSKYRTITHPQIKSIQVYADIESTAQAAAQNIISVVQENPQAVITYATGNTQIPVYQYVASQIEDGKVDFSQTTAFHLDEYYPIDTSNKDSFVRYLYQYVFKPFKIKPENIHTLDGSAKNPQKICDDYNKMLAKGVDLCILGIGPGGHIAFDEKGSSFKSVTRLVDLSAETIHRDQVERKQDTPSQALTQGIANILAAKQIMQTAYGLKNADNLKNALYRDISEDCPSSCLRLQANKVKMFFDQEAASQLPV